MSEKRTPILAQAAWLAAAGSDMMIVLQGGCRSSNPTSIFFNLTSLIATEPAYWQERWEVRGSCQTEVSELRIY